MGLQAASWHASALGPEVADILRQFKVWEPTGFLQDDFDHIPISDPALEGIRDKFERLADSYPEWEPQAPFHRLAFVS
jgi:hypothetical protein